MKLKLSQIIAGNKPDNSSDTAAVPETKTPEIDEKLVIAKLRNEETYARDKCMVWINNEHYTDDKTIVYRYLRDTIEYFTKHDPSRIMFELPLDIDIKSIDIVMKPAKIWQINKESGLWIQGDERKTRKTESRNRARTAFEIGMISPPSAKENSDTMNSQESQTIYYSLYQQLQYKNKDKVEYVDINGNIAHRNYNRSDAGYILTTPKKQYCPYVQHIKINEKYWLSGVTKLETERQSAPSKQVANKFRSGFLSGWSMPFDIQLTNADYHSAMFGTEPMRVQLCLEANEKLVLYRLPQRYYRSNSVNTPLALTQERVKMLELASVDTVMLPQMKWLATAPKYEHMADQMNQYGKLLPSTIAKFTSDTGTSHLTVTDTQIYIGKRVLCELKKQGERLVVRTTIKPEYNGMSWIKVIVGKAEKLMLQANVTELKNNHIPIITSKTPEMQAAHHKMKVMLGKAKSLVRYWQPDISGEDVVRLGNLLVKHAVVKMNMDKSKFLGLFFILKSDELKYRNFMAEVLNADRNDINTEFHIHLLNDNGKLSLPKDVVIPTSGTLFVSFGYKVYSEVCKFTSTTKLEFDEGMSKNTMVVKAALKPNDTISHDGVVIVSYNDLMLHCKACQDKGK